MHDDQSPPLTLRDVALVFMIAFGCFAVVAWVAVASDGSPMVTLLDVAASAPWVTAASVFATGAYALARSGWSLKWLWPALRGLPLAVPVFLALYLMGLFLAETSGLSPPMSDWPAMGAPTVSFFGIYTAGWLLLVAAFYFGLRVLDAADRAPGDRADWRAVARQFRPFIVVFTLVLYVAGLVAAQWLRIGPALGLHSVSDPAFWRFLPVYTAAFLALPFVVFALLWAMWILGRAIIGLFRAIGRSETWRRLVGAQLSREDFDAALAQERAEREEWRSERRRLRRARRTDKADGLRSEISEFGAITARFLWWAPVVTFFAQLFSFVTSYLGIRIYLDLRSENMDWASFTLPAPFGWWQPVDITLRSNDVLAIAASAIMAVIIWGLSSLAVARVRQREPIPAVIFLFIMVLGSASTYTAFIMWNGELATREELSLAMEETAAYQVEIDRIDRANIDNALRDVTNLGAQLADQQEAERTRALRGHLLELQNQLDRQAQSFARASDLRYFLEASLGFQDTFRACEQERGCLSNLAGRGEVVKELEKNVQTFTDSIRILDQLVAARTALQDAARTASLAAVEALETRDLAAAQREIARMRAAMISAEGEDPVTIFRAVDARLSIPISGQAPTPQQRQALASLQEGIDRERNNLSELQTAWQSEALDLPPEIRLDEVSLLLGQDIGLLSQVRGEFEAISARREREVDGNRAEMQAVQETIRINAAEDRLIQNGASIFSRINALRDDIELMGSIDLRPTFAKMALLESDFAKANANLPEAAETYPRIDAFQPTTLAWSILKYAYLSVVPLMIQVMLDFGYTLIVVIVAARLRVRSMTRA